MPALDQCEPQVIRALQKAGWIVTHQPLQIRISRDEAVYADLRLVNPENTSTIIVVEVKCFSSTRSLLDEFYHAIGQYIVYRNALALGGYNIPIYLSVPDDVYNTFFQRRMVQSSISDVKIRIVTINLQREEIVRWIE